MSQMVVITGPERRRRWSADQKQAVLAAADAPGAVVSEVARRADICTSLIYRWRKEERRVEAGFVPARLVEASDPVPPGAAAGSAAIVVELAGGTRVSIGSAASVALVTAALRALR
jgi:transposase